MNFSGSSFVVNDASNRLMDSFDLSTTVTLQFNGTSAGSNPIRVDGSGLCLNMARTLSPMIFVAAGKTVELSNIVLKDFSPAHLMLGAGSRLLFGDNVCIQLADNANPLTYSWVFSGTGAVIDGRGKALRLNATDALLINDAKSLTLKDLCMYGLKTTGTAHSLRCIGVNSQLILEDAKIYTDGYFNAVQGNMLIKNDVSFCGADTKVAWTSPGRLTIDSFSSLTFDFGTTFSYDSAARSRNNFVMTDYSSWLKLNNARFHTTRPGLVLSSGSASVENAVIFSSEALNVSEAFRIDRSLKVYVPLGASIEPRGIILYE
ncbi:hypothetical protein FJ366_02960 [Candidatus Dependentiae bacterium]|nr:hypothetical protein [Candidatus Dependentiae bacterium]